MCETFSSGGRHGRVPGQQTKGCAAGIRGVPRGIVSRTMEGGPETQVSATRLYATKEAVAIFTIEV